MSTITEHSNTISIAGARVDVGERISLNPAYPPVAHELLLDIVFWARQDANPKFATWGSWDQQSWAEVVIGGALAERLGDIDTRDDEDWEAHEAVEEQAIVITESAMRANVCGTAFCMAGQAVYQAGFRIVLEENPLDNINGSIYAQDCIAEQATGRKDEKGFLIYEDVEGAYPTAIHAVAQEALGLTTHEADLLFDGDNDIDKIHEVVNLIVVNRGLPIPFPTHDCWEDDNE